MPTLRDVGLSEYEARVYRALLRSGSATAKELSQISDVPMGRIYDVLNTIERQRLARSQVASRPKKYVAVEPETALNRLLENKTRELAEQQARYESIVEELIADLDSTDPVDEGFWTAAVGAEESFELLLERLAAADDRIVVVADSQPPQFDLGEVGVIVTETLEEALDRGVDVSVLMSPTVVRELPRSVGLRYRTELSNDPSFEVRTIDRLNGTFNVIDDVEVCIQVPNPLDPDRVFATIDVKDVSFATDLKREFEQRWEAAKPLEL